MTHLTPSEIQSKRKSVDDYEVRALSSDAIIGVVLKDGWTKEDGNSKSMDYSKITVKKVRPPP